MHFGVKSAWLLDKLSFLSSGSCFESEFLTCMFLFFFILKKKKKKNFPNPPSSPSLQQNSYRYHSSAQ